MDQVHWDHKYFWRPSPSPAFLPGESFHLVSLKGVVFGDVFVTGDGRWIARYPLQPREPVVYKSAQEAQAAVEASLKLHRYDMLDDKLLNLL